LIGQEEADAAEDLNDEAGTIETGERIIAPPEIRTPDPTTQIPDGHLTV
jgi:hypothetical protein